MTANGAVVFGKELAPNKWEIATLFDANSGVCTGGEKVQVSGKLQVEFEVATFEGKKVVLPKGVKQNGNERGIIEILLPKDASKRVNGKGQSNGRNYQVDRVEVEIGRSFPNKSRHADQDFLCR